MSRDKAWVGRKEGRKEGQNDRQECVQIIKFL